MPGATHDPSKQSTPSKVPDAEAAADENSMTIEFETAMMEGLFEDTKQPASSRSLLPDEAIVLEKSGNAFLFHRKHKNTKQLEAKLVKMLNNHNQGKPRENRISKASVPLDTSLPIFETGGSLIAPSASNIGFQIVKTQEGPRLALYKYLDEDGARQEPKVASSDSVFSDTVAIGPDKTLLDDKSRISSEDTTPEVSASDEKATQQKGPRKLTEEEKNAGKKTFKDSREAAADAFLNYNRRK